MKVTRGLTVASLLLASVVLTACADNTGAIDQKGHDGYDLMACNKFRSMANEVEHDAITAARAVTDSAQIQDWARRGGDPRMKEASLRLKAAYAAGDLQAAQTAIADLKVACTW
jgi:hypothetical protein